MSIADSSHMLRRTFALAVVGLALSQSSLARAEAGMAPNCMAALAPRGGNTNNVLPTNVVALVGSGIGNGDAVADFQSPTLNGPGFPPTVTKQADLRSFQHRSPFRSRSNARAQPEATAVDRTVTKQARTETPEAAPAAARPRPSPI